MTVGSMRFCIPLNQRIWDYRKKNRTERHKWKNSIGTIMSGESDNAIFQLDGENLKL